MINRTTAGTNKTQLCCDLIESHIGVKIRRAVKNCGVLLIVEDTGNTSDKVNDRIKHNPDKEFATNNFLCLSIWGIFYKGFENIK